MSDSPEAARPAADQAAMLAAVRAGDAAALGEVYRRHSRLVYGVAWRVLASEADAEDVLQDVFVGLPRALRNYTESGSFEGWLKRVAVRTALMKRRAEGRRREEAMAEEHDSPRADGPFDIADRMTVRRAIEGLPAELRVVFMLKEVEGYSHAEIGAMLGITSGASAARLFRAWRAIRSSEAAP